MFLARGRSFDTLNMDEATNSSPTSPISTSEGRVGLYFCEICRKPFTNGTYFFHSGIVLILTNLQNRHVNAIYHIVGELRVVSALGQGLVRPAALQRRSAAQERDALDAFLEIWIVSTKKPEAPAAALNSKSRLLEKYRLQRVWSMDLRLPILRPISWIGPSPRMTLSSRLKSTARRSLIWTLLGPRILVNAADLENKFQR